MKYCNNCGETFDKTRFPCCEEPMVGDHMRHLKAIMKQNRERKEIMTKDTGATEDNSWRWGISLPPYIFNVWSKAFEKTYKEKFIENEKDLHGFMKAFPAFRVCNKV